MLRLLRKQLVSTIQQVKWNQGHKQSRYRRARDKACQFLLARQNRDGSFGNPQRGVKEYFKVLSAYHVCGHTAQANHLCQWIRTLGMTSNGDFGPRPAGGREYDYIYPNAWIIIGAHQLGWFDISQKGMEFLGDFWDPKSGGFYSSGLEREASTKQDLIYSGFAGLAALYTGNIDMARGVGRWMKNLLKVQPSFPQKLYTVYSRNQGLHTQFDIDSQFRYLLSGIDSSGDQPFFQVGVAGGFLARLFLATGEKEWLDLAKEYLLLAELANNHLFHLIRAGKVGWAASLLFILTGEPKYKDMATRIGDFLVSTQARQGYWSSAPGKSGNAEITAEMVIWLDAIDRITDQP